MAVGTPDLAVIGTGYWGKNLARNHHALGSLACLVDGDAERLAAVADLYPAVRRSTDVAEVFADPSITKVAIATPPATHIDLIEQAFAAGKDVFVEKPVCEDLPGAERLAALAAASGRVLMVGHLLQYHPVMRAAAAQIADGACGTVRFVESRRCNIGKIYTERNVLWNFGPHDLTLVLLSLPGCEPVSVRCTGADCIESGCHDVVHVAIVFDNGAQAHLTLSWISALKEAQWLVYGDQGSLVVDDTVPWDEKLVLYPGYDGRLDGRLGRHDLPEPECPAVPEGEPLKAECEHFLQCCADRSEAESGPRQFLTIQRILDAAQRSLDAGGELITFA